MSGETVFSRLWNAYRGIILQSIVTSFGLDFLVQDQRGGDVDTIHGVRESGQYKNPQNSKNYEKRGEYESGSYHNHDTYSGMVRAARDSNDFFEDAYVPWNKIYYGKASGLGSEQRANLDHVISAHEIHDDRARVLAGLDGVKLANQQSNLQFTNEQLNKSMRDMTIEEYIQYRVNRGDPLPSDVVAQLREKDSIARGEYERRISEAYYSSDTFLFDAAKAA